MKTLMLFIISIVTSIFTFAGNPQVKNFKELMEALNSGKCVKVIIHYQKCQLICDNEIQSKSPAAVGGMMIDTYEFFDTMAVKNKKAFVVSSTSKLIEYPKGDGYVYNYVKIKISDDNNVKIIARYVDPVTFETKMDESFYAKINDGKNNEPVYLYIKD